MHNFFVTLELIFTTETQMQISWIKLWLTHFVLMTPYNDIDLGQHGSGNGLLPSSSSPSPELMLTYQ